MPHKRQSCLSCHTQTNQQFLQTVAEQTTEMEALHIQLRYWQTLGLRDVMLEELESKL